MFIRGLMAAVMTVALAGCVSPLVKPDPPAWQHKAGDARDWQEMARETVAAIPVASNATAYNVYVETDGSQFGDAYKAYLQEALFAGNYGVTRSAHGADITIAYDVQRLLYAPGGKKRITDYASLLSVAVAALGQFDEISSLDTGYAAGIATGAAWDTVTALDGATDAEVVVVSKVLSPKTNNLHFVRSQTFYVRPSDLALYMAPEPGLPVLPLRISSR